MSGEDVAVDDGGGMSLDAFGLVEDDEPAPAPEPAKEPEPDDEEPASEAPVEADDEEELEAEEDEPAKEAESDPEADKVVYKVDGEERTESIEGFAKLSDAGKERVRKALELSTASQKRFDDAAKLRKDAERIETEHKEDREAIREFMSDIADPERFEEAVAALGERYYGAFKRAAIASIARDAERAKLPKEQREHEDRIRAQERELREREWRIKQAEEKEKAEREEATKRARTETTQRYIGWLEASMQASGLDPADKQARLLVVSATKETTEDAQKPVTEDAFAAAAKAVAARLGAAPKPPEAKPKDEPKPKAKAIPPPQEGKAKTTRRRGRPKPKTAADVFGEIDAEYGDLY